MYLIRFEENQHLCAAVPNQSRTYKLCWAFAVPLCPFLFYFGRNFVDGWKSGSATSSKNLFELAVVHHCVRVMIALLTCVRPLQELEIKDVLDTTHVNVLVCMMASCFDFYRKCLSLSTVSGYRIP